MSVSRLGRAGSRSIRSPCGQTASPSSASSSYRVGPRLESFLFASPSRLWIAYLAVDRQTLAATSLLGMAPLAYPPDKALGLGYRVSISHVFMAVYQRSWCLPQ